MIAARGMGRGGGSGLAAPALGRRMFSGLLSTFQDCIDLLMYITRSVSATLER